MFGILALAACDELHRPTPLPALAKPTASAASETAPGNRAAYELLRLRQRLAPPPLDRTKTPCSDQLGKARPVLFLRQVDERAESRHLLPLRITEQLESHELDRLAAAFEPGEVRLRNLGDAARVLRELTELGERRYLGVYHVTEYSGPELILRVGKLHREWVAGRLHAWFVLYDLKSRERLCSGEIAVSNDTRDAPITSRLRSETRERLEVELGQKLVQKAREWLGEALTLQ